MRKIIALLTILFTLSLVACGKSEEAAAEPVDSISVEDSSQELQIKDPEESEENTEFVESADPSVDLDLTALSSTLIYAEVSNMMMEPVEYEGKTVKMEGVCGTYQDPDTGKKYYACIIQDATQCCSQGLEFVLDDSKYTEKDYPAQGDEIAVKGTFATYEENGGQYLTMLDAVLLSE